jgi:transposase, IS6 family
MAQDPSVRHNQIEADHGRLKAWWLRAMRELKQDGGAGLVITGHAFVQNVRRGHDELADAEPADPRLAAASDELAVAIRPRRR